MSQILYMIVFPISHCCFQNFTSIDNIFMKELDGMVNSESTKVIFIDDDQNSVPNGLCVYSFRKRDLLG